MFKPGLVGLGLSILWRHSFQIQCGANKLGYNLDPAGSRTTSYERIGEGRKEFLCW